MRSRPASSPRFSVPATVAGKPPRDSTQLRISSWLVVVLEEEPVFFDDEGRRAVDAVTRRAEVFLAEVFFAEYFFEEGAFFDDIAFFAEDDFFAVEAFFEGAFFVEA